MLCNERNGLLPPSHCIRQNVDRVIIIFVIFLFYFVIIEDRQQIVVPLGFLFAQLTHFSTFPSNLLPPVLFNPVVTIGVPGVLVLLQFAQLTPQLLAEEQSISFLVSAGESIRCMV